MNSTDDQELSKLIAALLWNILIFTVQWTGIIGGLIFIHRNCGS